MGEEQSEAHCQTETQGTKEKGEAGKAPPS
jgi:hypothetical protein